MAVNEGRRRRSGWTAAICAAVLGLSVAPAERNPHYISEAAAETLARIAAGGGRIVHVDRRNGGYRVMLRRRGRLIVIRIGDAPRIRPE